MHTFELPRTNTLEILGDIEMESTEELVLELKNGHGDKPPVTIALHGADVKAPKADVALALDQKDRKLNLRIFVDRSMLEVFANDTACATKVISPLEPSSSLQIQTVGGTARAKRIQCWPMKTIW